MGQNTGANAAALRGFCKTVSAWEGLLQSLGGRGCYRPAEERGHYRPAEWEGLL